MIIKMKSATSNLSANPATADQLSSAPRRNVAPHFTVAILGGLVLLALAWGLYESIQFLTGVIPKF
jgi:hypothetical protein